MVHSMPNGVGRSSDEQKQWRQQQLRKAFIEFRKQLHDEEVSQISKLLSNYHDAFSLSGDEKGETEVQLIQEVQVQSDRQPEGFLLQLVKK